MEIYLSYQGSISTTGHTRLKFQYRRHFLPQLREAHAFHEENDLPEASTFCEDKIREIGAFKFLPLITLNCKKVVDLDIVLLSHFEPGNVKRYPTGDTDNLLKALLDGLRMAQNKNEIRSEVPHEDETPFYCLLEDDQIVRNIQLRHDRLLFPVCAAPDKKEVFVLIKVIILPKFA